MKAYFWVNWPGAHCISANLSKWAYAQNDLSPQIMPAAWASFRKDSYRKLRGTSKAEKFTFSLLTFWYRMRKLDNIFITHLLHYFSDIEW